MKKYSYAALWCALIVPNREALTVEKIDKDLQDSEFGFVHLIADDNVEVNQGIDVDKPIRLVLATNPLDTIFGTDPRHEGPVELERSLQLMNLAERLIDLGDLLINNDQTVTLKTIPQPARFSRNAVAKKNKKAELGLDLTSRLSVYGEQIERNIQHITTFNIEIEQHEQQMEVLNKTSAALQEAQNGEKAYREKLSMQANGPKVMQLRDSRATTHC